MLRRLVACQLEYGPILTCAHPVIMLCPLGARRSSRRKNYKHGSAASIENFEVRVGAPNFGAYGQLYTRTVTMMVRCAAVNAKAPNPSYA